MRAFEISAIDYLLKRVTAERFRQALERVKARLQSGDDATRRMVSLLETIASPSRYVKRLAVRSGAKTSFVNVEEVDWIEAAENYVELHAGAAGHLVQATMNTLEASAIVISGRSGSCTRCPMASTWWCCGTTCGCGRAGAITNG
jgi:two-component system LytT family response regulator